MISKSMQIRIRRIHPAAELPAYAHGPHEDAGMDLRSVEDAILQPGVPATGTHRTDHRAAAGL